MKLYFRHRENGVTVFRMEVANRQRRIELNQIASVLGDGRIIPHKRRQPTDKELAEIETWLAAHKARQDDGSATQTDTFITQLNQFTDWVARRADPAEIDGQSDALLTALLDLRQVVVRKLAQSADDPDDT